MPAAGSEQSLGILRFRQHPGIPSDYSERVGPDCSGVTSGYLAQDRPRFTCTFLTISVKQTETRISADRGPRSNALDSEKAIGDNENYRTVVWTGRHLHVTLICIPAGEPIGLEAHPHTDQFLRVETGHGRAVMGSAKDQLDFEHEVADGWSIQVPAGTWHDVINTGNEPLRLYTVYAPSHHAAGAVEATSVDAARDESAGADEPPPWTAQPTDAVPDKHGKSPDAG